MGYSVHQTLINLTAQALICYLALFIFTACVVVYLYISTGGFIKKFLSLADSICHLCHDDWFAIESCHLYIFICCNNNTITSFYFLSCQHIFRTTGTIGLNFNRDAHFFRFIFQTFCRHISMCDSSRTCGNCQHPIS